MDGLFDTRDSAATGTFRVSLYNDSTGIPRVPDGTAIPYKASNIAKRIGYADITVGGNTSTAAGVGQTTFIGCDFSALPSNKIYGVVEHLAVNGMQKNEHFYFKAKGWARRPLP